ncbi:DUF1761 domain-containing protein [Candidatus Acetothermia bacterium]|nr:DUF1761 domain-containing protein [Candidatus Acetothermia bacterium]MBI3643694.1 DUF1761 domain-containing protein [Candidatus Acetothermia bacterium]
MADIHINYLAVLVSSVAAFVLGGLWYSPLLFAKLWVKAHGFSEQQTKEMQKKAGPGYFITFLGNIVMALVFSALISYAHPADIIQGLWLGFLLWVGFALTTGLSNAIFSGKSMLAHWIDAGYQLIYILLIGAILTIWQ